MLGWLGRCRVLIELNPTQSGTGLRPRRSWTGCFVSQIGVMIVVFFLSRGKKKTKNRPGFDLNGLNDADMKAPLKINHTVFFGQQRIMTE